MRTTSLGITLLALGLCIGCSNNTSTNPADMSAAVVPDLVTVVTPQPDMTVPPPDLTPPDMAGVFNGCDDTMFTDRSGAGASRTVMFGGGLGTIYSPRCILISQGQMVTFSGDFSMHPLRAGTITDQNAGTAGSPIASTMTGMSATFTFNAVGTFPFICLNHGATNMTGVVRVK